MRTIQDLITFNKKNTRNIHAIKTPKSGLSHLDVLGDYLLTNIILTELDHREAVRYDRKPELLANDLYGDSTFWYILLFVNKHETPDMFTTASGYINTVSKSTVNTFIRMGLELNATEYKG